MKQESPSWIDIGSDSDRDAEHSSPGANLFPSGGITPVDSRTASFASTSSSKTSTPYAYHQTLSPNFTASGSTGGGLSPYLDSSAMSPTSSSSSHHHSKQASVDFDVSIPPSPAPSATFHSPLLRSASESEAHSYSSSSTAAAAAFARLPKGAAWPDPYAFRSPHNHLVPPALSSASSASTRSSAYTTGSAAGHSDLGHVHVVTGDEDAAGSHGALTMGMMSMGISADIVQMYEKEATPAPVQQQQHQSPPPLPMPSSNLSRQQQQPPASTTATTGDQTRYSGSYSASSRSRSSSFAHSHENNMNSINAGPVPEVPKLRHQSSYDMGWHPADERDEVDMISGDESDGHYGAAYGLDDDDVEEDERTSAMVVAEEGRGLIVKAGNTPLVQIDIQPGTTHLLLNSSATPNALPSFLNTALQRTSTTLLALDISANYLGAVPPALTYCISLEELNISSNPLRVLPEFLADLTQLRVLIADATGISTLPDTLHELDKLHTLSIRRNKLYSLPSWLCLLPALQTLLLDGNPFQGPWRALVDPLLAKETPPPSAITTAATPTTGTTSSAYYPLSTPMFPLASASASSLAGGDTDTDDSPNGSDGETGAAAGGFARGGGAIPNSLAGATTEEDTIVPHRVAQISRAVTSPVPLGLMPGPGSVGSLPLPGTGPSPSPTPSSSSRGLQRTRTAPNRSYNRSRDLDSPAIPDVPAISPAAVSASAVGPKADDSGYFDHEIRRMKSAGELRGGAKKQQQQQQQVPPQPQVPVLAGQSVPGTPERAPMMQHSVSSSNLLSMRADAVAAAPPMSNSVPKRYASLGAATGMAKTPSRRPGVPRTMWDDISEDDSEVEGSGTGTRTSDASPVTSPPQSQLRSAPSMRRGEDGQQQQFTNPRTSQHVKAAGKEKEKEKEKSGRWGFLKKMSMGKIKNESPSSPPAPMPSTSFASRHVNHPAAMIGRQTPTPTPQRRTPSIAGAAIGIPGAGPQISMRISTTGTLNVLQNSEAPVFNVSSADNDESASKPQPSMIATAVTAQASPSPSPPILTTSPSLMVPPSPTPRSAKRRSFLPLDLVPPAIGGPGAAADSLSATGVALHPTIASSANGLNIPIPPTSAFVPSSIVTNEADAAVVRMMPNAQFEHEQLLRREEEKAREAYLRALRSVMAYLKDMNDLSIVQAPTLPGAADEHALGGSARLRRPTMSDQHRVFSDSSIETAASAGAASAGSGGSAISRPGSSALAVGRTGMQTLSVASTDSNGSGGSGEERKFKDDKSKRAMVVREIVETERTYVKGLQELVDIYIKPASATVNVLTGGTGKDTVVPATDRKIVFGGLDSLFTFHKENFLPALEMAAQPMLQSKESLKAADADGHLSIEVAKATASIFVKHAAFMRMYSTYINNFDTAVQRVKMWTTANSPMSPSTTTPSSSTSQLLNVGMSMSAVSAPGLADSSPLTSNNSQLTTSQRKKIKQYLKRCRMSPRHSQLNLEGYLLLPIQRIPRYKLLLEELLRSTPPPPMYMEDPLEKALAEISALASNMNEGKREAEGRRKLVQWQSRIRGKFPSPLVQPHRRLIMDGALRLKRVVRKTSVPFDVISPQGSTSTIQVECLAPELTTRPLMGILCNDLLVLCRDPSEGRDPASSVDLWAVLRMQTQPQPASIVHGNVLRLVDNKAILYFDAPSSSEALNWFRAINLHIPTSKN